MSLLHPPGECVSCDQQRAPGSGYRMTHGMPFDEIRLDMGALLAAIEFYEDATGTELDVIPFGRTLIRYLEAAPA